MTVKMNILKTCTDISRKGIWNKNIQSKIPSISGANKANQSDDLKIDTKKQFSTIAKTSNGKFPVIQVCQSLKTVSGSYQSLQTYTSTLIKSINIFLL